MSTDGHRDAPHEDELPDGELSYTAASRELDGIVAFFEKSEVDVDQLVSRLERATAIVDELDRRIRRTRAQVEELVPKLEAAGRAVADPDAPSEAAGTDAGARTGDGIAERGDTGDDLEEDTLPF